MEDQIVKILHRIVTKCPVTHEKQKVVSTKGKESGLTILK